MERLNRVNRWLWKRECWRHRKAKMKMGRGKQPFQWHLALAGTAAPSNADLRRARVLGIPLWVTTVGSNPRQGRGKSTSQTGWRRPCPPMHSSGPWTRDSSKWKTDTTAGGQRMWTYSKDSLTPAQKKIQCSRGLGPAHQECEPLNQTIRQETNNSMM